MIIKDLKDIYESILDDDLEGQTDELLNNPLAALAAKKYKIDSNIDTWFNFWELFKNSKKLDDLIIMTTYSTLGSLPKMYQNELYIIIAYRGNDLDVWFTCGGKTNCFTHLSHTHRPFWGKNFLVVHERKSLDDEYLKYEKIYMYTLNKEEVKNLNKIF